MRKLEDIINDVKNSMGAKDVEVSQESMELLRQVAAGKMKAKDARKLVAERMKGL